ncbi:cation efflux family-domain-containing protein [Xylaria sp. FL0043]|nr:cation efflux family-domain-containing protein [Xylaria sp. FL0043]
MASMHVPPQDIERVRGSPEPSRLHDQQRAEAEPVDPLDLGRHRRTNVTRRQLKSDYPSGDQGKLKKFYIQQNTLIDQFLGAQDEERLQVEEGSRMAPRIKFAVNASFAVNFGLFSIQVYATASAGSLSPSVYKYLVGRTRIETIGIILFCSLLTTVAVELLIESIRTLAAGGRESGPLQMLPLTFVGIAIFAKGSLMCYCLFYRRYPSVHVFFIDHRNDVAVNAFGLTLSIIGNRIAWFVDPIGAIVIGLLILFLWVYFISKLIYLTMTHDSRILKVDTASQHQSLYVEVDIIMDEDTPLKISHDVSQSLQKKFEGLSDVERAFVHVDYDCDHDPYEEHKRLYKIEAGSRNWENRLLPW